MEKGHHKIGPDLSTIAYLTKDKPKRCSYCKKLGHTIDQCYKKLGKQHEKNHAKHVSVTSCSGIDDDDLESSKQKENAMAVTIESLSLDNDSLSAKWASSVEVNKSALP